MNTLKQFIRASITTMIAALVSVPVLADTTKLSKEVNAIVKLIAEHKVVESEKISESAKSSEQYQHFINLSTIATDNELIALTEHKSAAVKVYAFLALAKKHHPQTVKIFEEHLHDRQRFICQSGCRIYEGRVNKYFLAILTPEHVDLDCLKLGDEEIKKYSSLINRTTK